VANAFPTANVAYELPLDGAPVKLRRDQRYGVGVIFKGATAPQIFRVAVPVAVNNLFKGRRLSRYKSGLSTLAVGAGIGSVALANSDAAWKSDTNIVPLLYVATS
jgi:hypothetical protein